MSLIIDIKNDFINSLTPLKLIQRCFIQNSVRYLHGIIIKLKFITNLTL